MSRKAPPAGGPREAGSSPQHLPPLTHTKDIIPTKFMSIRKTKISGINGFLSYHSDYPALNGGKKRPSTKSI